MKREPGIHITKSTFKNLMNQVGCTSEQTDSVFSRAKVYAIHTRTITISSDRMEKKVKNLTQSSRLDADLFAKLIYARRKHLKHRGISQIKPASKEWATLKGITAKALNFVEEFDLNKREGFIEYINIGLERMKRYNLNRFVNLYEPICGTYQSKREIMMDDKPELTREMYNFYQRYVINETGILDKMDNVPDKYVWFVRANKQALDMGIDSTTYIKAQFSGLSFARGIPHPSQLVGDNAHERVVRYMYKEGINVGSKKKWLDLNKIFSDENISD